MFNFENLKTEVGSKVLYDIDYLHIADKAKIGLLGKNGSGKTSLLKQIKSESKARNINAYYLSQLFEESEMSIFEYISDKADDYWNIKLDLNLNEKLSTLSGGERILLEIELALLRNPQLLLLDEPSNHLDIENKVYLTQILNNIKIPFILVSHDIALLNNTVTEIWELKDSNISVYGGNYDFYLQMKEIEIQSRERNYEVANKKIRSVKSRMEKEKQTSEKVAKKLNNEKGDRSTDRFAKGFFKHFGEITESKNLQKSKSDLDTALNERQKYQEIQEKKAYIGIPKSNLRIGQSIIHIQQSELKLNPKVTLKNVNLKLNFPDRLHITGKNGSGKTSFIKYIISEISNIDKNIHCVFLDQKYSLPNPLLSVYDNMVQQTGLNNQEIRRILGNFLFITDEEINKKAEVLSGGELCRLSLACITGSAVDILVLDEPTNNLDIDTKKVLMDTIKDFKSVLILVSHDENFVEQVGFNKIFNIGFQK
jgi:ATPase subunit of ABC transporter with duplicated ATPase domains